MRKSVKRKLGDTPDGEEKKAKQKRESRRQRRSTHKTTKQDPTHLAVQDDEMNNSWDSAQDNAMKVDLSNQLPAIDNKPKMKKKLSSNSVNRLTFNATPGNRDDDIQSYQSVQEEIN